MIEDFNPWWASREGVEEVEIYRRYAEIVATVCDAKRCKHGERRSATLLT